MPEMFGAPIGIDAAEAGNRQMMLGSLQTMKGLGELAMQPAQLKNVQAEARLRTSDADLKDIQVQNQRQMLGLSAEFNSAYAAQAQQVIAGAASQGKIATAADLTAPKDPVARSQAFLQFLESKGVSEQMLLPLRKEVADVSEKYAMTAYRNSQAVEQQAVATKHHAEQAASWATSALAAGPANYQRFVGMAGMTGVDTSKFPQTYDQTFLNGIRQNGIEAAKQADLALTAARDKSTQALQGAEATKAAAQTALTKERTRTEKTKADILTKYGGANAEATVQQKQAATAARKDSAAAKQAQLYPQAPLDPKARTLEKTYTFPTGERWTWRMNPATGKPDWWRPAGVSKEEVGKAVMTTPSSIYGPAGEGD